MRVVDKKKHNFKTNNFFLKILPFMR